MLIITQDANIESAKLLLSNGGPIAAIVFHDGFVLTSLENGSNYEEYVVLSNPIQNRFIGSETDSRQTWSPETDINSEILLLSASTGLMRAHVSVSAARGFRFNSESLSDQTAYLSYVVEQAVSYGMSEVSCCALGHCQRASCTHIC
jgi:hypothetical protein